MQASVMQLFQRCLPNGPLHCGYFDPRRGVVSWGSLTRADLSSISRPLLIHLDDSDDKLGPTRILNTIWPLSCDTANQSSDPVMMETRGSSNFQTDDDL